MANHNPTPIRGLIGPPAEASGLSPLEEYAEGLELMAPEQLGWEAGQLAREMAMVKKWDGEAAAYRVDVLERIAVFAGDELRHDRLRLALAERGLFLSELLVDDQVLEESPGQVDAAGDVDELQAKREDRQRAEAAAVLEAQGGGHGV